LFINLLEFLQMV